ncbi:hypothetical protein VTN77DRAFT_8257 [Rasamsonia byssochlamydoides]|uniref:uncharacterized protein n=1 Tax=Rasamsonia byssochlamydoides TaxID=89139 RepID=UPI0037439246
MPASLPSLPPKFVGVNTARSGQGYVNVIGVVVDCLDKTRSRGSSLVVTFTIKDSDLETKSWDGLKIKYFNDNEHFLPDLRLHDVILLRNLRIRPHQGALLGVATQWDRVPWAIFRQREESGPSVSLICSPNSVEPTPQEKAYANSLLNLVQARSTEQPRQETPDKRPSVTQAVSREKTTGIKKRSFSLIKDVSGEVYVDLVVHVVKTFPEQDKFLLYVTDYTTNKALFEYAQSDDEDQGRPGDEYGYRPRPKRRWQGPFGRMTLQVTLWQPHAYFAQQNVKEGDYVYLRNVHIKQPEGGNGMINGRIHGDRVYPDKICVSLIADNDDDPRVKELKKRKQEYWKRHKLDKAQLAKDLGNLDDGQQERDSKKSAKKRKKEQQQKKQPVREEGQTEIMTTLNVKRYEPNSNIKAWRPSLPSRSITDILMNETHNNSLPGGIEYRLPFQNLTYRATVRVVDFFPPKLEDFAVPYNPEYLVLSDSDSDGRDGDGDDDDDESVTEGNAGRRRRRSWEWRFCLLVEDAKPAPPGQPRDRMKLFVWGNEAVHLLRLDAVDLRKHPHRLHELREKLFILWGDLEERKNASPDGRIDLENPPSSKPFTCCVREYGVQCSCHVTRRHGQHDEDAMTDDEDGGRHKSGCLGWERRFALHGTTIM